MIVKGRQQQKEKDSAYTEPDITAHVNNVDQLFGLNQGMLLLTTNLMTTPSYDTLK